MNIDNTMVQHRNSDKHLPKLIHLQGLYMLWITITWII